MVPIRKLLPRRKSSVNISRSDRVAESSPHTMREDRVILEALLAQNRNAILDIHNLTNTANSTENKQMNRTPSRAGSYHRQLTDSTGVSIPVVPDVLPPSDTDCRDTICNIAQHSKLERTFSKRGVRLGVHMSILDLSAHEAPNGLKKKWIQQANVRQQLSQPKPGYRLGLTALPELSRISEADTAAGSSTNLNLSTSAVEPNSVALTESLVSDTPGSTPEVPCNTPAIGTFHQVSDKSATPNCQSATVGSKLRRALRRMSFNNLRSPTRSRHHESETVSDASTTSEPKGKEKEEDTHQTTYSQWDTSEASKPALLRIDLNAENKPGHRAFLEIIKQKFERSPLSTPDLEKDFEYKA